MSVPYYLRAVPPLEPVENDYSNYSLFHYPTNGDVTTKMWEFPFFVGKLLRNTYDILTKQAVAECGQMTLDHDKLENI